MLNKRLEQSKFTCSEYSIADIANLGMVNSIREFMELEIFLMLKVISMCLHGQLKIKEHSRAGSESMIL